MRRCSLNLNGNNILGNGTEGPQEEKSLIHTRSHSFEDGQHGEDKIDFNWSPSVLPDYGCSLGYHPVATDSESLAFLEMIQMKHQRRSQRLRKRRERTVWEEFSASIEKALQNGNKDCPIPETTHPIQKYFRQKPTVGYSNNFKLEGNVGIESTLDFPPPPPYAHSQKLQRMESKTDVIRNA